MTTLKKLYAQHGFRAPRATDEKTHILMAEFVCNNGWYKAYHTRKNGTVQQREAALTEAFNHVKIFNRFPGLYRPGVGAVKKTNHLYDFGTSMVGLGMFNVRSRGILDVPPSPLNLAVVLDLPLAQQQQQQQQHLPQKQNRNWAAQENCQRHQEAREQRNEDQLKALPGLINDILDERQSMGRCRCRIT